MYPMEYLYKLLLALGMGFFTICLVFVFNSIVVSLKVQRNLNFSPLVEFRIWNKTDSNPSLVAV
jgi:hypothetical protein